MGKNNRTEKAFSNSETAAFCSQMALILKSGIAPSEGLAVMLEDTENPEESEILEKLQETLLCTGSFAEAVKTVGLFPAYMEHMVAIGEETGRLDDVMQSLATHYQREDEIRRSIRSTITYPLVMIGMMVIVIVVLLVKVMPIFNQVFNQLGTEMTGISKGLMNIGTAISSYSVIFVALLVVIILLAVWMMKTPSGKRAAMSFGRRFKGIRSILESTAACRFAGAMSLTLSSGIHPERGMELAGQLATDDEFIKKLEKCREMTDEGTDFSVALHSCGIFTGVYSRLASLGQKTGTMDQTMEKIAGLYQEEIDTRMNNFLAVLEPTMVVIISVVVGVILLSVMLPLIGIMSAI